MPIAAAPEMLATKIVKPVVDVLSPKSAAPAAETSYQVLEEPYGAGRKVKVICVGAGASGLNLQRELDTKFGSTSAKVRFLCMRRRDPPRTERLTVRFARLSSPRSSSSSTTRTPLCVPPHLRPPAVALA